MILNEKLAITCKTGQKTGKQENLQKQENRLCRKPVSSALQGVAAIVSSQMKVRGSAPYTHCRSHCINLSVASACKERPIRQFMDDLTSLCYFFSNSPKRQQYFEEFIAKY